ncbi:MAG: carbohydrate-binding domain-containing protein, partial [Clostridium sp.]
GDGIKASNDTDALKGSIVLEGGTFNIKSEADGINAATEILISGGSFTIEAGNDGIHADEALLITDGKINITKSYEGLESNIITLSGGEINIISTDDGINAAAGSTEDAETKDEPLDSTGTSRLNINGGYITVDASGDGLDANGSINMTSGTVTVSGPTTSNNGTLDYDGTFVISGGLLMASGSSGMAQATSEESTQNSIIMTYTETQKAGTVVRLEDSKGNIVGTVSPKKDYQSIVVSSPELVKDATYTLYSGETKVVEFPIANSVTWLDEQ